MAETLSQKIDLRNTQEENNLLGSLSPQEKKDIVDALNQYRQEKSKEQKLWVIILSHEEIQNLKNSIWNKQSLHEFLNNQLRETITSSEILSWTTIEKNLWWSSNLEKFTQAAEKVMHNYLFSWNDSLFWHLWLSPDAKNNLVVWFNFFVFDFLSQNKENLDIEKNISFITNNIWNLIDGDFSSFDSILSLWDKWTKVFDNLKSTFWVLNWKLDAVKTELNSDIFTNHWENNEIFMNPRESLTFFRGISDGSISNIQNYVIQKQTHSPILIQEWDLWELKEIGNKWWEMIPESVWSTLWAMSDVFTKIEDYKETIKLWLEKSPKSLEVLAWLEEFPLIWSFIKFIWGLLGINSFKELYENSQFWKIKTEVSTLFWEENLIISNKKVPDDFMKKWDNNDLDFLSNLRHLWNWEKDYKKILEKLLKNWGDFEKFQNFITEKNLVDSLFHENTLNYSSLSKSIDLYRQYSQLKAQQKELSLDDFIKIVHQKEKEHQEKLHTFNEIVKQETFEKTQNKITATCEINGEWYTISWNKHGEIELQSEDTKYFYFIESIKVMKVVTLKNTDFFEEHWGKIDINTAKWIIPLLLQNNTLGNNLQYSITHENNTVNFSINTTNVFERKIQKQKWEWKWVQNKWEKNTIENKALDESFVWNIYKYKSMSLISPFDTSKEISLVDEDWKIISYKLNYKNMPDWFSETSFDIKNDWWKYILKNSGLWIKINLKDLFNQLHTGINQVDIQKDNFFWLEFEKVQN